MTTNADRRLMICYMIITWNWMSHLEVSIGRVRSGSGSDGSERVSLTKKISGHGSIRSGSGRVSDWTLSVFFESRIILGRAGSSFRFLLTQVISNFGSFEFRSGRVSGHLILDNLGFRVEPGRVFLSCFISGRVEFRIIRL
jgi:hypothetical protein